MSLSDQQDLLHEAIMAQGQYEAPWAERACAFAALKKRASLDVEPVQTGLTKTAGNLMAEVVAEKLYVQRTAEALGLSKLAQAENDHVRFFLRKLAKYDWDLPLESGTKIASAMQRCVTLLGHLEQELGSDPMAHTVREFRAQDHGYAQKLAQMERAYEKEQASKTKEASLKGAVKLARVRQKVAHMSSSTPRRTKVASLRALIPLIKKANEAGMSLEQYMANEQMAQGEMAQNELQHARAVAQQALEENQMLSEQALMASQQAQQTQMQAQQAQMQAQQAMETAAMSESNAAEQANAKLRMKMRIDQMRQTMADLAAVNPQLDDVGPEPGMPQPEPPAGPQQQAAAAAATGGVAGVPPTDSESAEQQQEAASAQQHAQEQTAEAAAEQQEDAAKLTAAQVPMNAGAAGAPAVAPAVPTVPGATM